MSEQPSPMVVLIEDSHTQALQIAAHLTQRDMRVMVAEDGPQGLRLVTGMMPDVILLDLYLPTMDGFQVCRRLKRDPETANIPIIMLTSADNEDDKARGLEYGASAFITKDEYAIESLMDALTYLHILAG